MALQMKLLSQIQIKPTEMEVRRQSEEKCSRLYFELRITNNRTIEETQNDSWQMPLQLEG